MARGSWHLCYSRSGDGASFQVLLNKAKHAGELLISILDTRGNVFGAYLSEPLTTRKDYYGTGESFLYKV